MIRHFFLFFLLSPLCFSQSIDSLQNELKDYKKQDSIQVSLMINLAQGYLATGVQDSIFPLAEIIINTSNDIKWEEGIMQGNYIAGEYFSDIGQFKKAIPYLFDGIKYAEKRVDKSMEARFSKNIAFSYMLLKDAPKAIEWFQKSSDLFGEIGQERFQVLCLASIGTVYYTDSLNNKAVPYFEKALSQAEAMQDPFVLTYVKSQYALTLSELGKIKEAIALNESVISFAEKNDRPPNIAGHYANISELYGKDKQPYKSIFYAQKALDLADEYGFWGPGKVAANNLAQSYAALGNYNKAYEYQIIQDRYEDSLDVEEARNATEVLELKYTDEKKSLEIENLNTSLENQKLQQLLLIGGLLTLAIIGISFFIINRSLNKKNQLIELQKEEIEELNTGLEEKVAKRTSELQHALNEIKEAMSKGEKKERKRLASDLHDNLGSVLSAINMNLSALDPKELTDREQRLYANIKSMTSDAYQEVRLISHNLSPKELETQGLEKALDRLVEKLNLAGKTRFTYDYSLKKRLGERVEVTLYAIILELCNNTLRHAQAEKCTIKLEQNNDHISIIVWDNGVGIKDKEGYGITSIRNRVEEIDGHLEINSKDGTQFNIVLK